jgi:gluconate 5-dehydrogenase
MNDPLFSVAEKVVFISGGTRGIGRGLACGFASRGATVVISGRDKETTDEAAQAIAKETNGACIGLACDVADQGNIQSAVDQVLALFKRIDVLVNVAGVNRRMAAEKLTADDFDFVMDINLRGAFLLSQAVGKQMLKQASGSQINITSLNNHTPLHWMVPYAASKAALGQMTRALAMEWGPRGVRVNAIAPGFILSDFNRKLWANATMQDWGQTNTPLVRLGSPEDLIGTAIFLASDASAYMTGQVLYVDGGVTAGMKWPIEQVMRESS